MTSPSEGGLDVDPIKSDIRTIFNRERAELAHTATLGTFVRLFALRNVSDMLRAAGELSTLQKLSELVLASPRDVGTEPAPFG